MKDLRAAFAKTAPYKPGPVDPIDLFRGLRIRSGSDIKEMWAPQADALRLWNDNRAKPDVIFQLNTGAGKTLIGLIAAQSLVNETRGRVVYACVTHQLVEQTRSKAEALGLSTAVYLGSKRGWTDEDVYRSARGPVLTTYAAVFNGRSIFRNDEIVAAVFDDAHTAHDAVRQAFTVTVERNTRGTLYDSLTARVHEHFRLTGRASIYEAVVQGEDRASVLFVPMFEWIRHVAEIRALLVEAGASSDADLVFPWTHLSERIDRCIMLFDSHRVQITPLLPPVNELRPFRPDVRRLYLSATVRVDDEFVRTFGRNPDVIVAPGGRAGDTQRLFLFPRTDLSDEATRSRAEEVSRQYKTIVMVPSHAASRSWADAGVDVFESDLGHARVREFAESEDQRLALVARYDGIDLPDDACRVMVVDGLPSGSSLLDRFFESHLERAGLSNARIASRFVQLIGRTSRGMSDYGAVLLVGSRLLDWLLLPAHRALLPDHVQRQLAVGERLSALSEFSSHELIDLCLKQATEWTEVYDTAMEDVQGTFAAAPVDHDRAIRLAYAERKAADALWAGNPESAMKALLAAKDEAFAVDRNFGAWLLHWAACASQLAGDPQQASSLYRQAGRVKRALGTMPTPELPHAADATAVSPQAAEMAKLISSRGPERVRQDLATVARTLRDSEATSGVHEEAIRSLGEYLAYDSSRPERETGGKGPDVLWASQDGTNVLIFDAKTKKINSHYDKELVGQSAQHYLWVQNAYPSSQLHHFIVGPRVPATPQATPPAELRVVDRCELARVADAAAATYAKALNRSLPLFYAAEIELGLVEDSLTWTVLPTAMDSVRLSAL